LFVADKITSRWIFSDAVTVYLDLSPDTGRFHSAISTPASFCCSQTDIFTKEMDQETMKTSDISFDEFLNRFETKILVCHGYPQNLLSMPPSEVNHFIRVPIHEFELIEDFNRLANVKLVWYENASGKSVNYNDSEAKHLELHNEIDEKAYPPGEKEKITRLIENLKINGLTQDIELISVTDTKLDEEIIVDGVHRAIAIYHCFQKEQNVIKKMLSSSRYGIYLINLQSPEASVFFQCDFSNFHRQK
jgi:hypothetical protein